MNLDKLGVVVIGRNEGQRLIDCLMSLKVEKLRVVYVDSGSTDGSVGAAKELGALVISLDLAQPFTAARARNEGFVALKTLNPDAKFVQFVDGDCELVAGWLDTALAFIEERNDVAIVCGRRRERYPERSVYNRLCDIEWNSPLGEVSACGGDCLVRGEAFEQVDGFDPKIMAGEEPEMCARLRACGWKVCRIDVEMTRHDAAMVRFSQWWRRAVRSGYGYAEGSTLRSPSNVWGKELVRAIIWGGALPLLIGFSALFYPPILWLTSIYLLQICRIALRNGPAKGESWICALFTTLAKFSEFQGIVKFYWRRWRGRTVELIEYKRIS
jgi:GT2 family glycosyltransferase